MIFFHGLSMEKSLIPCNEMSFNLYNPEPTAQVHTKQNHGHANGSVISTKTGYAHSHARKCNSILIVLSTGQGKIPSWRETRK